MSLIEKTKLPPLYDPSYEHDACGTGFIVDRNGEATHQIVQMGIEAVVNLMHRGAIDSDQKTGDGAGLLTQIPKKLINREIEVLTGSPANAEHFGLGMMFLPSDPDDLQASKSAVETKLSDAGLSVIAWREVPVNPESLGAKALASAPSVWQVIVEKPATLEPMEFERHLYVVRRYLEDWAANRGLDDFSIPSFSSRTVVYKGFFVATGLKEFYLDLSDEDFESALVIFHQRYSTNTFPTWALAQPFHMLGHNGEINTLQGNRNWMAAREAMLESAVWGDGLADLLPVIDKEGSDSLSLDNVLELLELSGRPVLHAMRMLVPQAWEQNGHLDPAVSAFYDYHSMLMEPWDGPAALTFSDGTTVGAVLDRNGLRPCRFLATEDGLVVAGSEAGIVNLEGRTVVERGRLGPGEMIAVDTATGDFLLNDQVMRGLAGQEDYEALANEIAVALQTGTGSAGSEVDLEPAELMSLQVAFGFSAEDQRLIVQPMAAEGQEPLWSMGDDAPLTVLSEFPQPLASFFRQRFAQVTNPAIDPLRESIVTSLNVFLGQKPPLLDGDYADNLLRLPSPFLSQEQLDLIRSADGFAGRIARIRALFMVDDPTTNLQAKLDHLVSEGVSEVENGAKILILSDRGVNLEFAPIPMPLIAGALHHALIRSGLRSRVSIVCETGDVWDIHQAAVLFGYGVNAIYPYLAAATAEAVAGTRRFQDIPPKELSAKYLASLNYGLLKVMSKMGISAVSSYQGAQLFEILGLSTEVTEKCFAGTPSPIGGIGFNEIEDRIRARHRVAFEEERSRLPDYGLLRFRREGEYHAFSPTSVRALQSASNGGGQEAYQEWVSMIEDRQPTVLRDILDLQPQTGIPIEQVEPMESIRRRFVVTAMSLGALSPEAYRTLAQAMHRIGSRSNSGEGGEDRAWYYEAGEDVSHSKIKQVASGRFGVTAEYLSQAQELEIKIAQGSKPGEGGQLPAHKVTDFIARLRHSVPGISLISPPPHHDIYSIEDLAQLIYDLKQVNPRARVGVKLVSSAGVGTIAAGVAKAYADYVLISGHSGGTGASPLSSIKHAGAPWELGLAATQQTLMLNGLRDRITVRTDGGLQTARDVIIAALLGAEEFGFGTAPLVSIGCDMARQCHMNTCPTGIATQRPELREKFKGKPENVIAYFTQLAEEVRSQLAALGATSLDEIIGRTELLKTAESLSGAAASLDANSLMWSPNGDESRKSVVSRNDPPVVIHQPLDAELFAQVLPAFETGDSVSIKADVRNHHRAVGARISGEIAVRYGAKRPENGLIELQLKGSAGQSLGAWCTGGLRIVLEGEANDYVGKGMSGGEIAIRPNFSEAQQAGQQNILVGNTVLYGATGGELFVAGGAGERFGVRNSGATAVVEGVGDHGCEYMTGGTVIVLGSTGRNFGAGMTNGVAYMFDPESDLPSRVNAEFVQLSRLDSEDEAQHLRSLIQKHFDMTGSSLGLRILEEWRIARSSFWKVAPVAVEAPEPKQKPRRKTATSRA